MDFKRMSRIVGALMLLLAAAGEAASQIPEGFTPIFNGRDLTGWHPSRTSHQGSTPGARVEDGAIVLQQYPYGQGGILLTNRKYKNFELYVEVKTDWGTNGGIFLRSAESAIAYQVELVGDGIGATGDLLGERMQVSVPGRATALAGVWKQGDWNAFRIRMEGEVPHLTLWVNGVQMWDVTQTQNDFPAGATEGYIGLQTHWSSTYTPLPDRGVGGGGWPPDAAHSFRNIAIKELP
jgi:hypothetical protein